MDIDRAALSVYQDSRRVPASAADAKITRHVENLVRARPDRLQQAYCSVSGSTHRDTHLGASPDFDIGLWPVQPLPDYRNSVEEFVNSLAEAMRQDQNLLHDLSLVYNAALPEVDRCLSGPPAFTRRQNEASTSAEKHRVVAKYRLPNERSILEVTLGRTVRHATGLLYSRAWEVWITRFDPPSHGWVLAAICLLKHLASVYEFYGRDGGGASSAVCEQLIIGVMGDESTCCGAASPLRTLAEKVRDTAKATGLTVEIPIDVSQLLELGFSRAEILSELPGASFNSRDRIARPAIRDEQRWVRFQEMSQDLMRGQCRGVSAN